MTLRTTRKGICPRCEREGIVGETCSRRACRKKGFHHIPEEYVPDAEDHEDVILGQRLADYLVVQLVGVGGFGKVYLALQQPIQMKVALKLLDVSSLPPKMSEIVYQKFEGEAAALAVLQHPNIVKLLQYGTFKRSPYLVMEYVDGGVSLAQEVQFRARSGRRFRPEELESLFLQLLDGLEAAHDRDIVHRDIKPDNLMIQAVSGNPRLLRILDFGLAKYVGAGSSTMTTMGTPDYMAPEQITSRGIGPWTDLYAVGVLAFELLTGRLPYPGETYTEVLARKSDPSYDPLERAAEIALPPPTVSFLRKALARSHQERYRAAPAFRAAFLDAVGAVAGQGMELPLLEEVARLSSPVDLKELETEPLSHEPKPETRDRQTETRAAFERWMAEEGSRLDSERQRLVSLTEERKKSK